MSKSLSISTISPKVIAVTGLIIAILNAFASNVLSNQLTAQIDSLPTRIKVGIPLVAFILTIALAIGITLRSG